MSDDIFYFWIIHVSINMCLLHSKMSKQLIFGKVGRQTPLF